MKILILGHGRHGKDTAAEILRDDTGIKFRSSSDAACEIAVFPYLSEIYGYATPQQCFQDRANHRAEWKQLITDYNTPDKAKLCKEIIATHDCYVGMRCPQEYAAVRHLFALVLWIDARERVESDPTMSIDRDPSMIVIDNNQDIENLECELLPIGRLLRFGYAA